jgi:DNA-binding winged helix-turn-helix (wHTH) protein/TolB-like protein
MTYVFGVFRFESRSFELYRDGRRVALEPQPAKALALLLARAGEIVPREELRKALWNDGTHVDYDRGLAYCVGQVRSALGDSAETPRFVQTLPKRGFRFVAPVSATPAPEETAPTAANGRPEGPGDAPAPVAPGRGRWPGRQRRRWWWAAAAAVVVVAVIAWPPGSSRRPVVAVSIFDNETGDAAYDGFVTGLSDVVVTHLTALAPGKVGVVGNAAPLRQPRNIRNLRTLAETLEADYIILGQLQRQGDGLRFIVHFIRLRDEVHLSAQRFVTPAADVATFQQAVVAEAERAVRAHVLGSGA